MAGLIAALAGQAGGLQQQAMAGGFNTLNSWLSNQNQLNLQDKINAQQKWNFQNREKAFTENGLPSFMAYNGGMQNMPQTMSHLGGTTYQRTGVLGNSFRGAGHSMMQQMAGFNAPPEYGMRPLNHDDSGLPSYDEATSKDPFSRYRGNQHARKFMEANSIG